MRLLVLALALLAPHVGSAITIVEPYQSGEELCTGPGNKLEAFQLEENGLFVDVPVDYANPSAGSTKIYAWTAAPFEPSRQSVVYFDGGPGGSSHFGRHLETLAPDWNVVRFDARGIGCSRPSDKSLLNNQKYFSSENTARDANEIRKALGIGTWSVYGISYGTIPATIAGNLFKDSLRSVTLEGVIFSGEEQLWTAPHRRKILQRYFDHLPSETQEKVLAYSNRDDVPKHWFSVYGQSAMYESDSMAALTKSLDELLSKSEAEIVARINEKAGKNDAMFKDGIFFYGTFNFLQISCAELSGSEPYSNFWYEFSGRTLVPAPLSYLTPYCKELGYEGKSLRTYHAVSYPLTVPVTYIQGGYDGATEAPSGIRHWKQVAKGAAQLIIAPTGGHIPSATVLTDPTPFRQAFVKALEGQKIPRALIDESNAKNEFKFRSTSKGF